ncbi:low temperature requirement protein A [Kitasatospora sp. NBC_00315]|uniref:low temperature requirement protein A n=1 Tax=Kitasatospora sp. NBC_00315 TaxID=2975963 RepID=UPI00352BDE39
MTPRSKDEPHRASTPLELFFDLCFVVAVAQAGRQLGHYLAEGHYAVALTGYVFAFFASWWAWTNRASGYPVRPVTCQVRARPGPQRTAPTTLGNVTG